MEVLGHLENEVSCKLTESELVLLKNALAEICFGAYAIEEFEFETLMGAKREDVSELCKKFKKAVSDLGIEE